MKVKEAADAAGISVRTLHHWDQIGLLKPTIIRENGYRFYTESDLVRLQNILFFKELDFSLADIKRFMESPDFDRADALKHQHELLLKKRIRLNSIITTIENTILSVEDGIEMNNKAKFEAFDISEIEEHKKKYAEEAEAKYGNSNAYKESSIKTSNYSPADWQRITQDGNRILAEIASLMDEEINTEKVQKAVEKWRAHITDNYYNCTVEIFKGLSRIYSSDERFRKNIDKTKKGLAVFLTEAIEVYCDNNLR